MQFSPIQETNNSQTYAIKNNLRGLFMEKITTPLLTAVLIVASIIFFSKILGPLPLAINQTVAQRPTTFNVTGKSEIATVPDQVQVSLGISSTQTTVASAQQQANNVISTLTEQLKGLGVSSEDIQTENYSIFPQYDYQSPYQRITGYQVTASLRVKLRDFSKLNQAIDLATAAGANQVGNIQFTLSDDRQDELKKDARKQAIADAKENAQELANLSGLKLGNIVDIQESNIGQSPVIYSEMAVKDARGGEAGVPTAIEPGSTSYTYSVTLSYQTL